MPTHFPRLLVVPFLLMTLLAPVTVPAAAAGVAKRRLALCEARQKKARVRLDHSLQACTQKGAAADVGRCGAVQWTRYAARLQRSGCAVVPDTARRGAPLIAKIRATAARADDLAVADTEVADAHLALRRLLARLARAPRRPADAVRLADDLGRAVDRLAEAEDTLSTVERAIWNGLSGHPSLPWLIDEPLRVMVEQVQVEVRRLLGPQFHTEIAALAHEPACGGDLIGDRLVAAYGEAVVAPGTDRTAEVAALGRFAALLTCLSARQTDHVDYAIAVAYDLVATRLEQRGLGRLRPDFARLFAPIETLVFDVVKLAGEHAHAYHWFDREADRLRDAVARLGWATDDVLWLYDRLEGRLVGFTPCRGTEFDRCVDLPAFLDSMTDPRAIGLGDCAFSGMVASGLKRAGAVSRYACPSVDCAAGSGSGSSVPRKGGSQPGGIGGFPFGGSRPGGTATAAGPLPWSGITSSDRNVMQELGCRHGGGGGGGGTGSGDGGQQGPRGGGAAGDSDCMDEAIHAPRDPYAVYVQCVATAAGNAPGSVPAATIDLAGVPMSPECGAPSPASGGGSGSGTTTPGTGASQTSTTSSVTSTTAASATSTTAAPSAGVPCVPSGILDAIQKIGDCGFGPLQKALTGSVSSPGAATAVGGVVSAELELLKPENGQQIYGTSGAIMNHKVDLACASGQLSEAMCSQLATMKPGEQAEFLRNTGHLQDCVEPEQCESVCTTVGEQVMQEMHDCQSALDETLRGDPVGQNDRDARITPAPDADTGGLPADPLTACLLASAGAGDDGGLDLSCAFVSCSDGISATGLSGAACCGARSPALGVSVDRIRLEGTCERVQCADGDATVADGLGACGCGSGVSGGGDAPAPTGPPSGRHP